MLALIKWIFLSLLAYILVVVLTPVIVLINLYKGIDYLKTVAIGFDQAGGSVLYNEEDWTISSYSYMLCLKYKGIYCIIKMLIDMLFGVNHCRNSYENEIKKMRKELKDGNGLQ